jgi:hypothetical protein
MLLKANDPTLPGYVLSAVAKAQKAGRPITYVLYGFGSYDLLTNRGATEYRRNLAP